MGEILQVGGYTGAARAAHGEALGYSERENGRANAWAQSDWRPLLGRGTELRVELGERPPCDATERDRLAADLELELRETDELGRVWYAPLEAPRGVRFRTVSEALRWLDAYAPPRGG